MLSREAKQRIQLALGAAIAIAAVRTGYILYERHQDYLAEQKQVQAKNVGFSNADYYVVPKKLYPYDLKSAKQLTTMPVWVKEGYRYTYYPVVAGHVDFAHDGGLLLPIERLQITDVTSAVAPGADKPRQVVALFQKDAKSFAVPIGFESDGQYKIYSDEMFYIEDPHELYKHWPADVWRAVDQHQVNPGMNELQAVFAVGMGVPDGGASDEEKTVRYPDGGKPLVVDYQNGKALDVKPGS